MDATRKIDLRKDSANEILATFRDVYNDVSQATVKVSSNNVIRLKPFMDLVSQLNAYSPIPVDAGTGKLDLNIAYVQAATMNRATLESKGLPPACIPVAPNDATASRNWDGTVRVNDTLIDDLRAKLSQVTPTEAFLAQGAIAERIKNRFDDRSILKRGCAAQGHDHCGLIMFQQLRLAVQEIATITPDFKGDALKDLEQPTQDLEAFERKMELYELSMYRAQMANQLPSNIPQVEVQLLFLALRGAATRTTADPALQIKLTQVSSEAERLLGLGALTTEGLAERTAQAFRLVRAYGAPTVTPPVTQVVMHVLPERNEPAEDGPDSGGRGGPYRHPKKRNNANRGNGPYPQKGKENFNRSRGQAHRNDQLRGAQPRANQVQQPSANPPLRQVIREQAAELQEMKDMLKKLMTISGDRAEAAFHATCDSEDEELEDFPRHGQQGYRKVDPKTFMATIISDPAEGAAYHGHMRWLQEPEDNTATDNLSGGPSDEEHTVDDTDVAGEEAQKPPQGQSNQAPTPRRSSRTAIKPVPFKPSTPKTSGTPKGSVKPRIGSRLGVPLNGGDTPQQQEPSIQKGLRASSPLKPMQDSLYLPTTVKNPRTRLPARAARQLPTFQDGGIDGIGGANGNFVVPRRAGN